MKKKKEIAEAVVEDKKLVDEEAFEDDEILDYDDDDDELEDEPEEDDTFSFIVAICGFIGVLLAIALGIYFFVRFIKWIFFGRKCKDCAAE
jgi:hypothetical protein